ncbi:unnamed protein product [Rhizopus stolonifer]
MATNDFSGYLIHEFLAHSNFKSVYLSMNTKRHQTSVVLDKEQMFGRAICETLNIQRITREKGLTFQITYFNKLVHFAYAKINSGSVSPLIYQTGSSEPK